MAVLTAADYQARIAFELPSRDDPGPPPVIRTTMNTADAAHVVVIWPAYQQWNNLDPFKAVDGPYLQYLHVERAMIDYLRRQVWQEVDVNNDGYEKQKEQYGLNLDRIRGDVENAIKEFNKLIVGLRGGAVGLISPITPESSFPGQIPRQAPWLRGDPRYGSRGGGGWGGW